MTLIYMNIIQLLRRGIRHINTGTLAHYLVCYSQVTSMGHIIPIKIYQFTNRTRWKMNPGL